MIKVILINEGLTGEAAGRSYRTPFGEALRGFSASRPLDGDIQGQPVTPFPGVVEEAWFDDIEGLLSAHGASDLAAFTGPQNGLRFVARENVVVSGPREAFPAGGVKLFSFLKRQPHLTAAEFQHYWREIHAPLVKRTPRLRRYVQNHFVPEHFAQGRQPACDGVAELWWDTMADFTASWASEEMQVEQFHDARKFLNGGIYRCLARETSLLSATQIEG